MAGRRRRKRVDRRDLPLPDLRGKRQICPFHSFSGYLFQVAFPALVPLLREQRVTGCRKAVMPSSDDFLGFLWKFVGFCFEFFG